jgi:hypothetical protein
MGTISIWRGAMQAAIALCVTTSDFEQEGITVCDDSDRSCAHRFPTPAPCARSERHVRIRGYKGR